MGTVSNAENPIATVVARLPCLSRFPGSIIGQPAGIISLGQCFAKIGCTISNA